MRCPGPYLASGRPRGNFAAYRTAVVRLFDIATEESFLNASLALKRLGAALGLLALTACVEAAPVNFSYIGAFEKDNDVQYFTFTASGSSVVRLRSFSFGGGVQANGNVVVDGSFDPNLSLFDGNGLLIAANDDSISRSPGACGRGVVTPYDGDEWDACMDLTLAAGKYTVALTQYDNFARGPDLTAGFRYDNDPDFLGCSEMFCGKAGKWAFDLLSVEDAYMVPEPASLALFGVAALGIAATRRRKTP